MTSESVDLCKIPAGVSPNGVYNFVDPPCLGPVVIAVGVALGVTSTALAAGRLYLNRIRLHSADYPNYYRHSWDIPVCWYTGEYLRFPFVQTVLFAPAFFFPKAAIFLLYRQLFAVSRPVRAGVNMGLVATLLVYLSNVPLAAAYAAPRPGRSWAALLSTLEEDSHPFALGGAVQSAVGMLLDFYIFFLPLPVVWHLRMPMGKRLQLVGVFSTALLGVAAGVASLYFRVKILSSGDPYDTAWLAAITSMCSLIESNIAIIVGSMPAFAQVVTVHIAGSAFFKSLVKLLGSRRGRSSSDSNSRPKEKTPHVVTIGANQAPRRNINYYELTDSALLKTDAAAISATEEPEPEPEPHVSQAAPIAVQSFW